MNLKERLEHWGIYIGLTFVALLLVMGIYGIWRFFFPKPDKQINKPIAVAVGKVEKGAIDQTSTQVLLSEKPWEIGGGGGGLNYDGKNGFFVGGWVKRRW